MANDDIVHLIKNHLAAARLRIGLVSSSDRVSQADSAHLAKAATLLVETVELIDRLAVQARERAARTDAGDTRTAASGAIVVPPSV